jgi:hypothetical protein
MDDFFFISAYGEEAKILNPGLLYIQFPEMEGDIWLRQLLKFQYPNHKTEIRGGANLRPALVLFKLMLELDGLSTFEIGLAHLLRNESVSDLVKLIKDYRIRRKNGNIENLQEEIQKKQLALYFSSELKEKINDLLSLINRIKIFGSKKYLEELKLIFALGKGAETKRAKYAIKRVIDLIEKKDFDLKKYKEILLEYFLLVKIDTIWKDYTDLTKRYLSMCRILQQHRSNDGEIRLRIDPQYEKIIKNVIDSIGPVWEIKTENEAKKYIEYLGDINKPKLIVDDLNFLKKEINSIRKKLKELKWEYKIDFEKLELPSLLITKERLIYNILQKELRLALELKFAKSIQPNVIVIQLEELLEDDKLKEISPNELESLIWESILAIGGFKGHPSGTRNFHVDTNFKSIFTAAGNQPDMQFNYEKLDVIIEVTKSKGKTQWRAEAEPVTRHIAIHKFKSEKSTIGIFLAPSIHEDTEKEFYIRSKGTPVIIDSKGTEISIQVIPLSFAKYIELYKKVIKSKKRTENWVNSLLQISELIKTSENHHDWISKINEYISKLKLE